EASHTAQTRRARDVVRSLGLDSRLPVKRKGARRANERRIAYGDWQTPPSLAEAALTAAARILPRFRPATIVEPTCGDGSFLVAGRNAFPEAALFGYDIDEKHAARARRLVSTSSIPRSGAASELPTGRATPAFGGSSTSSIPRSGATPAFGG